MFYKVSKFPLSLKLGNMLNDRLNQKETFKMKIYVGIDLHSTNSYFAVMNERGERLFHKRYSNNKASIMKALDDVNKFGELNHSGLKSRGYFSD